MYKLVPDMCLEELADILNTWEKEGYIKDEVFPRAEVCPKTRKMSMKVTVLLKKVSSVKKKTTKKG